MSGRIAHRPHYRTANTPTTHLSFSTHKQFFHTRWAYCKRSLVYEKHALGHRLSLIPLKYRLMQHLVVHQAYQF